MKKGAASSTELEFEFVKRPVILGELPEASTKDSEDGWKRHLRWGMRSKEIDLEEENRGQNESAGYGQPKYYCRTSGKNPDLRQVPVCGGWYFRLY